MTIEGTLTITVTAQRRDDGGVDLTITDSDDPHERRLTGLPFSDVWAMGPLAGELCGQRITEIPDGEEAGRQTQEEGQEEGHHTKEEKEAMTDSENTRPIDVVDAKDARTGLNVTITGARADVEHMIELIIDSDEVTGHAEPQIRNHPEAPPEADIVVAVLLCAPFDLGDDEDEEEESDDE